MRFQRTETTRSKDSANLVCVIERLARRVLIRFAVVDFQSSKQRVLKANVHADDVVNDCVRFVCFER